MRLAVLLVFLASTASAQWQGGGIVFKPPSSGGGTPSFPLFAPNGACPGVQLGLTTNEGFYTTGAGVLNFCANGVHRGSMNTVGVQFRVADEDLLDMRANFTILKGKLGTTGAPLTLFGADSSGSGTAGGDINIQGGDGTVGNADGGDVYLIAGRRAGTGTVGRVQVLERTTAQPTVWFQSGGDRISPNADYTNATATMSNTALTPPVDLVAGRKYTFSLSVFATDSVAADGAKIDFDGGTATATVFRAHCSIFDAALLLSTQSTALATDFAVATMTGAALIQCEGFFLPATTGTFIVRAAQNAHTTGTLTIHRGSYLWMHDTP